MEAELSIKEELQLLRNLQELDVRARELRNGLDKVPKDISGIDADLKQNEGILDQARLIVEDQKHLQRQLEAEVGSLREKLSKYKSQLMEVKTNKEYQAMLREIEGIEQQIQAKEDQVLELMLAGEDRLEEARDLEKEFQIKDRALREKRAEIEAFGAKAEQELAKLEEKRAAMAESMPLPLLQEYQRIFDARGGRALSRIVDGFCEVCKVVLRPQLIAEVKTASRIARCEACNRILYYAVD